MQSRHCPVLTFPPRLEIARNMSVQRRLCVTWQAASVWHPENLVLFAYRKEWKEKKILTKWTVNKKEKYNKENKTWRNDRMKYRLDGWMNNISMFVTWCRLGSWDKCFVAIFAAHVKFPGWLPNFNIYTLALNKEKLGVFFFSSVSFFLWGVG